jgi:hypothetical protein
VVVGTPDQASEGLVVKPLEKEERRWRLAFCGGLAPEVRTYEYVSKGRHYVLAVSVFYDSKGNVHPFGPMRLTINYRKTRVFRTYSQLRKFLERKGVPLEGIDSLVRLWGE